MRQLQTPLRRRPRTRARRPSPHRPHPDVRRTLAVLLVVIGFLPACTREATPEPVVRLDGTARFPDDEGIATALSRESITLDGERTYRVSDELRSFSTYTRELEPMIGRKGQYVQIGVDDGAMVWMAGVARVLNIEGEPAVFYTGRFREAREGRFVFTDGTTFEPAKGVPKPGTRSEVTVRIDPRSHQIVEIT